VTPPAAGGDDPSKDAQRPTVPVLVPVAGLNRAHAEHESLAPGAEVPLSLELRHLRYFVALADTGNLRPQRWTWPGWKRSLTRSSR
jgi:hypothetical protein